MNLGTYDDIRRLEAALRVDHIVRNPTGPGIAGDQRAEGWRGAQIVRRLSIGLVKFAIK
jgi:hypothetical protein